MSDRVTDAVWGAIAGHTLGSTQIGSRPFKRLAFYEPGPLRMPPSPAFDAWLVFARFLSTGEGPEALWRDSLEAWQYATEASAIGRANSARGVPVPLSGRLGNPYRSAANALARTVFWGLVFPGRPEAAADWAFWDASFDHADEGVWTAVSAAASVAAAAVEGAALSDVLRAATAALPTASQGSKVVSAVLQSMGESDPLPALKARWEGEFPSASPTDAILAFGSAVAGVTLAKDTASAVTGAAGFGGAADQSASFAGTLASLLLGRIAPEWTEPLGDAYVCGHGLRAVEPPTSLAEFAATVAAALPHAQTAGSWRPSEDADVAALSRDVRLEGRFPGAPIEHGSDGWQVALTLTNTGAETTEAECRVVIPDGAESATRLGTESLPPGRTVTRGLVVRRQDPSKDASVTVHAGPATLRLPVIAPQLWFVAGPFENESQDAFEANLPAERRQNLSDRFNGRSGLLVQWTEWPQFGRTFDVEPLFRFGPGAVVLWARVRLAVNGPVKVVAAGSPGVSLTVDGTRIVRYNDYHVPRPGLTEPYVAEFTPNEETTVLVKLVRDRRPSSPFVLLFYDREGRIVEPVGWKSMDP